MQQRISLITLGVQDLQKSRAFYDALGWKSASTIEEEKSVIVYNMSNGMALALFGRKDLAKDAQISSAGSGFRGVSIAYNVDNKAEVAHTLKCVEAIGGKIVKPAQDVFWGGHAGYFTDPDGHLWEVACNPFSPLGNNGEFQWGDVENKEITL